MKNRQQDRANTMYNRAASQNAARGGAATHQARSAITNGAIVPPMTTTLGSLVENHLRYSLGRQSSQLKPRDWYRALALAVRDITVERMVQTEARVEAKQNKRVYYLSMEFLLGRSLDNNLANLGILELARDLLGRHGVDLDRVLNLEPDPALGNGGLGRLAACFLDSMASMGVPGYGYGINYEFGLFRQEIDNGYQSERPDHWDSEYSPWLIPRPEESCLIPIYGHVESSVDRNGNFNPLWLDWQAIIGIPYDLPIVGYGGETVNFLRLYSARSSDHFDMEIFNEGDYLKAVEEKIRSETISKVLYPSDSIAAGRELRLLQEYFFVACAARDILRRYRASNTDLERLGDAVAIQLNDTHPALMVVELMRTFVDEHDLGWDKSWAITQSVVSYTNHTLMPEALERWPVDLMGRVLPRHLDLIFEINRRFLNWVAEIWPGDTERQRRISLIDENDGRQVRMANLAVVGGHSINGVSVLHSDLVRTRLVPDFAEMWPERFNNKTNGISQRRWLHMGNPSLARLITDRIGDGWIRNLNELRRLEDFAHETDLLDQLKSVKQDNKVHLAQIIAENCHQNVDPQSLFDIQAKRIHEYKRQVLFVLAIIDEYLTICEDHRFPAFPRTCVFAGKAAPGYWAARMIIKLINSVAEVINHDPQVKDMLKVVFIPDYKVSTAQKVIAAADLSEQLSTAGTEASGTGNMKFAMNGALTLGTWDGANIEIAGEVGNENIYIFGMRAEEIARWERLGGYDPRKIYLHDDRVRRVLDALHEGLMTPSEPEQFKWLYDSLLGADPYFNVADLPAYLEARERIWNDYADGREWQRKTLMNIARMGKFSSDRTIAEYACDIWKLPVQR